MGTASKPWHAEDGVARHGNTTGEFDVEGDHLNMPDKRAADEAIARAEALVRCFEEGSVLRVHAERSLEKAREVLEHSDDPEQHGRPFPAFFRLIAGHGAEDLRALQEDFRIVNDETRAEKKGELEAFWTKEHNEFFGGLFDLRVKAALLRGLGSDNVELDCPSQGCPRECDALVTINGKMRAVEATVLSISNDEQETICTA